VAILAMVAVGVMAGASSSAVGGAATVNVSTRAGVTSYLRSLGIDPRGVVVQRGAHNYAGPSCAGRGGTCTTARRVLQIAATASSTNKFVCTASTGGTVSPPNDCTIIQVSSGGLNSAVCVEQSTDAAVTQNCKVNQSNTTGANKIAIGQGVSVKTGATQNATQYAGTVQSNGTGANSVKIGQGLSQSTADPGGSQLQDGHQQVYVQQTSDTGANSAGISQSLALKAQAMGASSISQKQNTDGSLNSNAWLSQTSNSGRNSASVNQANAYDAHAGKADTATQQQGSSTGGLAVFFTQSSTGASSIRARQRENQNLHAEHVGSLTQTQYGPMWSDPDQGSNPGDTYAIDQSSIQNASKGANQSDNEYAECDTSGHCTVNESIHQGGGANQKNSCSGTFCDIGLGVTTNSDGTTVNPCNGNGDNITCFPNSDQNPPTPPPPPFSFSTCSFACIASHP